MADKASVLLILLLSTVQPISATYDDELKSPLDLGYILSNLNVHDLLSASRPSQQSPVDPRHPSGRPRHCPYSKTPGTAPDRTNLKLSQYSDSAGDVQYEGTLQSGKYNSRGDNFPSSYGTSFGQDSPFTGQVYQPLGHNNPLNPLDGRSSQQGSDLSSFGRHLTDTHYPAAIATSSPDEHHSGDLLDKNKYNPDYRTDVYADGHSGGTRDQNPQDPYQPDSPTKDLSYILSKIKPSSIASDLPKTHHDDNIYHAEPSSNDNSFPPVGGYFPDNSGGQSGGSVVTTQPLPAGGVLGRTGGEQGNDVQGSGGQHLIVPQHSYPTDVRQYRDQLKCRPQFFLQYERDFSGVVWQAVKGHVHVQQGRAVFQGQGFLAIPFFACNDLLPRYSMIFVISPSYSGKPQAVLGNSVHPGQASLLVALWDHTLTLVVRQRAPNLTPDQLLVPCNHHHHRRRRSVGTVGSYGAATGPGKDLANHTKYGEDVVVLQLTITGEVTVAIGQENDWIFFSAGNQHVAKPGLLPTLTSEALYVGAGADPRGGDPLANYRGTFDSFLFEKCP